MGRILKLIVCFFTFQMTYAHTADSHWIEYSSLLEEPVDSTLLTKKRGSLLFPRYGASVVSDGKWVYVYGGAPHGGRNGDDFVRQGLHASIERINPLSLKSEYYSNGLHRRANHASILLGKDFISCGGRSQIGLERPKLSSCEYLNFESEIFREFPALPESVRTLSLVEINGNLYSFGGVLDGQEYSNTTFRLQNGGTAWERLEDMPLAFSGQSVVVGEKIYAIGGYNGKAMQSVMVFDTKTLKWVVRKELPYPLSAFSAVSHGTSIFLFGDYSKMETIHRYDTETEQLFLLNNKITPRRHTAAVTINSRVLVIGGNQTSSGEALTLIEAFDLAQLQTRGEKVSEN